MTGWLRLTEQERKLSIEQAALQSGIQPKAIEKDWWVTLTLKALFITPEASHLVFKGGTSLSKSWKLIQRFSEDVDLALSPEALGMEYIVAPTPSYVKRLKREGCNYTSGYLKENLEKAFSVVGVPDGLITIFSAEKKQGMPDTDPQSLFVQYPSLYDPNSYLPDIVKIEVSVRSLNEPNTNRPVQSLLNEFFPNAAYPETPFDVPTMYPSKTFLEKAFLLHEEFSRGEFGKQLRIVRMSRHLYDLEKLMDTTFAIEALQDSDLYERLINHRSRYSHLKGVDYTSLGRQTISFIPPHDQLDAYQQDYQEMTENMIYESLPVSFDNLIIRLKQLEQRFRNS